MQAPVPDGVVSVIPSVHPAVPAFSSRVIEWQRGSGRNDLPWQGTRDPYRIWVSEIMLQQTQVSTVIPYFQRFMARFPAVEDLAEADESEVLAHWSGLGYYARGRNLHRAACIIRGRHGGVFPRTLEEVMALPGVGRSTAGAICAFAFGHRCAILDGNVKRVLTRAFGVQGYPGERAVESQLWSLSESLLPDDGIEAYTQGLMDLGASLCARRRPACGLCPLVETCVARREHLVDVLPTPKPRSPLPHRRTVMLMLWTGEEVLLEQRPASGIWGGLWSFPEVRDDFEQQVLLAREGVRARCVTVLKDIKHGFTHYHLTIEPRLIEIHQRPPALHEGAAPTRWMSLQEALAAGLPAPVRSMLAGLPLARA